MICACIGRVQCRYRLVGDDEARDRRRWRGRCRCAGVGPRKTRGDTCESAVGRVQADLVAASSADVFATFRAARNQACGSSTARPARCRRAYAGSANRRGPGRSYWNWRRWRRSSRPSRATVDRCRRSGDVPASGSMSRINTRPSVDLPEPDSPTSPEGLARAYRRGRLRPPRATQVCSCERQTVVRRRKLLTMPRASRPAGFGCPGIPSSCRHPALTGVVPEPVAPERFLVEKTGHDACRPSRARVLGRTRAVSTGFERPRRHRG